MKNFNSINWEEVKLIDAILGQTQFLMLNRGLLSNLGPAPAIYVTYVLTKCKVYLKDGYIQNAEDPFPIYRKELREKLMISDYQQKTIEADLIHMGVLTITLKQIGGETWNDYSINLEKLNQVMNMNQAGYDF